MTTATFIEQALTHVEQDVPALKSMEDAITAFTAAHDAVEPTQVGHAEHEDQIGSLLTLTQLARDALRDRISGEALRAGRLLGREVAEFVRADGRNEPIVWLTGNSMFPPLRSYTAAERVFTLRDEIAWEQFCEGFDKALDDAQVFCTCPEYDNALYAVDMLVWERVEDAKGDDLADEWKRIAPANDESIGELGGWDDDA